MTPDEANDLPPVHGSPLWMGDATWRTTMFGPTACDAINAGGSGSNTRGARCWSRSWMSMRPAWCCGR
ncbi:conserved hypothetical protein [Ricinus communis]|uniref:Uncharacterized protein n=1 Tax=Ricinus communis TaxID=3988 RepID=B9TGS2_RICCO|nr:conserved hypothetical protein [Ricinus communis]